MKKDELLTPYELDIRVFGEGYLLGLFTGIIIGFALCLLLQVAYQ